VKRVFVSFSISPVGNYASLKDPSQTNETKQFRKIIRTEEDVILAGDAISSAHPREDEGRYNSEPDERLTATHLEVV
jgi:hypothetical protein